MGSQIPNRGLQALGFDYGKVGLPQVISTGVRLVLRNLRSGVQGISLAIDFGEMIGSLSTQLALGQISSEEFTARTIAGTARILTTVVTSSVGAILGLKTGAFLGAGLTPFLPLVGGFAGGFVGAISGGTLGTLVGRELGIYVEEKILQWLGLES